jgi:hypothetical protein
MNTNRVEKTERVKRRVRQYASQEEQKKGVSEKNKRYYAKYKVIAQRKQRIRYATKKLEDSIRRLKIRSAARYCWDLA